MVDGFAAHIDSMLRGVCLGLLLLVGLRLAAPPPAVSKRLCLLLVLSIAGYLLAGSSLLPALPWPLQASLILLATIAPACFWLFAQALFDDAFTWRGYLWLPLLALAGLSLLMQAGGLPWLSVAELSLLQHVLAGGLIGHVLWLIWREQGADLLEQRRHLRLWLGPGVGMYILLVLLVELGYGQNPEPPWLERLNLVGIGLVTLWLSLRLEALLALLSPVAASAARPVSTAVVAEPVLAADEQAALQRLQRAMDEEQLWARANLSLADLASHLGMPDYRLRQLINGALGQRNFNSYLNQFRIAAACAQLADPARRRLPILTIALDVGFASIGPFNRAFKAQQDMTPSEFRQNNLI
ncbi:helix-turn-helix domain-containing protein [Atopomonas hussainii]|uniref:helix-turn-helix domain-containing protein n=1 Tax=Atopomonas hussainii TaxID=1429083 RepID=UPI0009002944|nr:AraC family transcriptional regulator [Atopomonas hussainii]